MVCLQYLYIDDSYPAAHVWIYTALYKITSHGKDIFSAQVVFLLLYLVTLAVTLSLYRTAKVFRLLFIIDIDSTICSAIIMFVKAITQYIHPATLQRLLDSIVFVTRMLVIRQATMDNWISRIRIGPRS
jgi:hypothetical protein